MKKQYIPIAFTLMASSAGFAQGNDAQPMRQVQEQQHPNDCCRPCCVPQPRDPICCECYVPSWNDMQCDWGLFLTVDYLYWFARECDSTYATRVINAGDISASTSLGSTRNFLSPTDAINMDTKWSSGVKVGLGWNTDCDGWDLYFQWTGYWNNNSDSSGSSCSTSFTDLTPPVGGYALTPQYIFDNGQTFYYDSVKASWDFSMNRFDLQLGKRYWLSKCFTLRPYTGIGGIWTETDFEVSAQSRTAALNTVDASTRTQSGKASIENNNWGAGLLGGFQPTFQFSDCFALYGDAGMALYWGKLKENNRVALAQLQDPGTSGALPIDQTVTVCYENDYFCMTPILDLAIGLRWETYWCDQQYHFAFDLGWEHHVLFHHNHRTNLGGQVGSVVGTTGASGITPTLAELEAPLAVERNIAMGGLVIRVRFDF